MRGKTVGCRAEDRERESRRGVGRESERGAITTGEESRTMHKWCIAPRAEGTEGTEISLLRPVASTGCTLRTLRTK